MGRNDIVSRNSEPPVEVGTMSSEAVIRKAVARRSGRNLRTSVDHDGPNDRSVVLFTETTWP